MREKIEKYLIKELWSDLVVHGGDADIVELNYSQVLDMVIGCISETGCLVQLDMAIKALEKIESNSNNTDFVSDTAIDALHSIRLAGIGWTTNIKHNPPPNEQMVLIKCDDWSGEYTMRAMRKDYKKPVKGQSKKGFKQGWRWIDTNGNPLTRKELPSAWKYL